MDLTILKGSDTPCKVEGVLTLWSYDDVVILGS